jgi:hypothetical protein
MRVAHKRQSFTIFWDSSNDFDRHSYETLVTRRFHAYS